MQLLISRQGCATLVSRSCHPSKSPVSVLVIHGNEHPFSVSVQLTIPWKNGSLEIPKVYVNFHLDPVKLQRTISLVHNIFECGEKGSEPSLIGKNQSYFLDRNDLNVISTLTWMVYLGYLNLRIMTMPLCQSCVNPGNFKI